MKYKPLPPVMRCTACFRKIYTDKDTYWVVYPDKIYCGVVCYKNEQAKEQVRQFIERKNKRED